jgi:hypothetical protein
MDWQPWLKLLHIAAGFTFAMAHGVSAFVVIRLRREREPARVGALLDLSKFSLPISDLAILVILASGIASAFVLGYWGHLWIWVAIGVLVFLFIFMSIRGVQHHDAIRHALGMAGFYDKKDAPIPEADPAALASALASSRGIELAAVGGIGLLVILWLMVVKPF